MDEISLPPIYDGPEEPTFQTIEPLSVEVQYIWSPSEGHFVAELVDQSDSDCLDMLPATAEVEQLLQQYNHYPTVNYDPPLPVYARFRLALDGVAQIPSQRASYVQYEGLDNIVISSSAWFYWKGKQTFLSCPVRSYRWRIYRVIGVEQLDSGMTSD